MIADSRITLNCVFKLLFFVRNVCLEVWQLQISKPSHQWLVSLFFRVALYWSKYNYQTPASFCSFKTQILQKKTVGFIGIRTRIVGEEGKRADHLTTTTAPMSNLYILFTILSLSLFYIRDPKYRLSKKGSPLSFLPQCNYDSNVTYKITEDKLSATARRRPTDSFKICRKLFTEIFTRICAAAFWYKITSNLLWKGQTSCSLDL